MSRRVVVTGASRGIGHVVAARFAELGDDVVAIARDSAALERLAGAHPGRIRAQPCDLADADETERVMGQLADVDVLVNNAGVSDSAPLQRTTLDSWQRQMAVNATAPFLCTRAVIGGMRARDAGRIITVASLAGRVGAPYASAYAASKHAAVGLMRSVAAELAGTRVTANAVCPAFVDTEMTRESAHRIAQRTGRSERESTASLAGLSPLGRLVTADEVADAVLWLASPGAGAVNGQTMILDGGGVQT